MVFHGLQKMTLLDYPGQVACTLFVGHCNFRCPFCQNGRLVLKPEGEPVISEEEVLSFLRKRQGLLDAVCVTGGEPTLYNDLPAFLEKVHALGYLIKLDTNGGRPDLVRSLISKGLIDYCAMDIKNYPEKYALTAGWTDDAAEKLLTNVRETASLLQEGRIGYEFRTTVVREFHAKEDMEAIAQWLQGSQKYFLQNFRLSADVLNPGLHSCTEEQLQQWKKLLEKMIGEVGIR